MRTTLGASLIFAALLPAAVGAAAQEVTLPLSRYDDLRARAGAAQEPAPRPRRLSRWRARTWTSALARRARGWYNAWR